MRLTVDRDDLKPEHKDVNCSQTQFEHFKPNVQQAIRVVGQATFQEFDRTNYNVVRPPDAEDAQ